MNTLHSLFDTGRLLNQTPLFSPERPPITQAQLSNLQQRLAERATKTEIEQLNRHLSGQRLKEFYTLLIGSRFAAEQLCEHPSWFAELVSGNFLNTQWQQQDYQNWFDLSQDLSLNDWNAHIRQQRNRAMARIIWRDFNRLSNTQETTAELTAMAEVAIQKTLDYHYRQLCQALGEPQDSNGNKQHMLILGMGKLGAWELNLSSDVDLIFCYPSSGNTQLPQDKKLEYKKPKTEGAKGQKTRSNQEFFTQLGQKIIQSLDQNTADGFVFRVDMRLRPYGQSGALVSNFNALEDYYQTQGREWERFAMIKARVIANSKSTANNGKQTDDSSQQLMEILRNFTYRGYVDFTAIDALRDLKQLISREVKRRKLSNNIKLGKGGIREVEFIAQAFQIIRGGRDKELQNRQLRNVLPLLCQLNCLPQGMDTQLLQAYNFLRNTEHAIQGFEDRQTQELPLDGLGQARIAFIMGFETVELFNQNLEQHLDCIHQQFNAVIATPDSDNNESKENLTEWQDLWLNLSGQSASSSNTEESNTKEQTANLGYLGFDDPKRAHQILTELLQAAPIAAMAAISRERFDDLIPKLLNQLTESGPETGQATETLSRLSPLLNAIARRSAYLLLLIENPNALNQLVLLSQASPWIATRLAEHPALLDELLNPESLYTPPQKQELAQDLRQSMLRIEDDDLEGQMEGLRYFQSAHNLRVAACEVTGKMPLMRVSDYLSGLAEVIVEYALQLAWTEMTQRHGYPDNDIRETPNFAIVGYGKLGGIELGHNSDLDLIFIHNSDPLGCSSGVAANDGSIRKSIDNNTFYARLGQKFIHCLNTRTPAGQLYEVDMRLRPSGESGPLTSSLSAFEKYQLNSAWTWEHQALVRARAIAGCPVLMAQFERLRQQVLSLPRPIEKLKQDVVEMRQKMRKQLGSSKKQLAKGLFHLKQDNGGIVDIEFMVQYAVLAWAVNDSAQLTHYTDNIRILGCLQESGQLNAEDADHLIAAYKAYRSTGHRLALQQQPSLVDASQVETERETVISIWRRLLE